MSNRSNRALPRSAAPVLAVFALIPFLGAAETREEEVVVSARDGVELATTVFLPAEGTGPFPCVVSRTPYNKSGLRGTASGFVGRGYVFVAQDCRGKFKSKGKYDPFRDDPQDGFDTVEWIARQGWSSGRVGMFGASALGITSLLAATQAPPHLTCAYVVVAESSARHHTVYRGGVYRKELNDGWLASQGAFFAIEDSVKRPPGDPGWDWREIADFQRRIKIPIYSVGGWHDIFTQSAIDVFCGLDAAGAGLAAGNQKLVMGPWAHGPMGGRLKFPDDLAGRYLGGEEIYRWFDRWLKDAENGIDREPAVRYYVMGDSTAPPSPGNEWRTAESWPPTADMTSYFLQPGRGLGTRPPAAASASTAYSYDPKKPVPTRGGGNLIQGGRGPMDQREIGEREDYLRFATEPLDHAVEVVGRIALDLHVESDAPDTDFAAKLVDVHPDGYEALLADGILRARYREGFQREVFLKPGEVVPLRIDLWSTANVFGRGHRIAVHISSSNDPRFDPNPNTGKPTRADGETRVARNVVHHSAAYPSRVLLPVTRVFGRGETTGPRRPARGF